MTKKNIPVKLNETYTAAIRDLGIHGEGIGSVDDFTLFVPGALPGETVTARIVAAKKSYAQGKLISIEKPSPFRTKPECPAYHACGGCQISHLTYEGQLAVKEQRVKDVVSRLGGFSEDLVLPVLPAENPWNYRNKMAVLQSACRELPAVGAQWHIPASGIYAYIESTGRPAGNLVRRLVQRGLLVSGIDDCYIPGFAHNGGLRLCVCNANDAQLRTAVALIEQELSTFRQGMPYARRT